MSVQGNYKNDNALLNYNEETLLINIHGVTNSGKVVVGFWAYVALLKAMRYTYLIGLLVSLPFVSFIGQKVYSYIAGNRLTERCTAENCAMPVYTPPPSEQDDFLLKGWNQIRATKVFWQFVILFLSLGQILMIWFSPVVQNNIPKVSYFNFVFSKPYKVTKAFYKEWFGITQHDVFLDYHFSKYNHIIRVTYLNEKGEEKDFPLINNLGCPFGYTSGAIWRNISFNVVTKKMYITGGVGAKPAP